MEKKLAEQIQTEKSKPFESLVNAPGENPKRKFAMQPHPNALAAKGDISELQRLIEEGVSIDVPSPNGTTPLVAAAKHGQFEVVKLLVKFGAVGKQAAIIAAIAANQMLIVDFLQNQ